MVKHYRSNDMSAHMSMFCLVPLLLIIGLTRLLTPEAKEETKRLLIQDDLLHTVQTLATKYDTLAKTVTSLQQENAQLKQELRSKVTSGSMYIRWGRSTCPSNGTELAYPGYAAGPKYTDKGGGSNYICMTDKPIWDHYSAYTSGSKLQGVEYELDRDGHRFDQEIFGKSLLHQDAPCAVCVSSRPVAMMIPGRNECFPGWTREYYGYLVANYEGYHPMEYVCLDINPEFVVGGSRMVRGALFYMVEGECGALACPPYINGRELTCVVCTK